MLRSATRPLARRASSARRVVALGAGCLALVAGAYAPAQAAPGQRSAAPGDEAIAWVEVEDGVISGGPALNSGDHGNFSGTGSYTFRETGMTSTMTVTAPAAGTYPVWIRYAAGPLGPDENVTRSMGLTTNGTRQVVSYPMTSLENWEDWEFARADVQLNQGANTIAVNCDRGTDFCRLNFDAIQVGGLAPDRCAPTPVPAGSTRLFDGTFASFDGWRKAGSGGFGRQSDCTIRGLRGPGATWFTTQQAGPYTLELDWRRGDASAASAVHVASSTRDGANPAGGYSVRVGVDAGTIILPDGTTTVPVRANALAAAVRPVGQWNRFAIRVAGSGIRVLLNGRVVNSYAATVPASGFVGLQNQAGTPLVDFRDIQVRPGDEVGRLAGPVRRAAKADGTTTDTGGESALANLVAESQRWATSEPLAGNARIAFVDPATLRADLTGAAGGYPAGVTQQQAAAVLADEPLVTVRARGSQIATLLEQQWRTGPQSFVHLGASNGLTWVHDRTRPPGSRITGVWLDGIALDPDGSYPVTITPSLRAGANGFTALAPTTPRATGARTVSALADHLADSAVPVAADRTQRSVGVAFPGGRQATYAAGSAVAVDLSSWSFSTPSDVKDTDVVVSIAGRTVGVVGVDNTVDDTAPGETGRVAVRAVLPTDLPAGPSTMTVVGSTTGTTVLVPITVTAAPGSPAPTPTPTPTPPPVPSTGKATPTLEVKVLPKRVMAGKTRARVRITVSAAGTTPTGKVTVKVGSKTYRGKLQKGRATIRLKAFAKPGRVKLRVAYAGDEGTRSGVTKERVRVRR